MTDYESIEEYAAAMVRAHQLTGTPTCRPETLAECNEALAAAGYDGSLVRYLDDALGPPALLRWQIVIRTARGDLTVQLDAPEDWAGALHDAGLL